MKQVFPILLVLTVIACTVPFDFNPETFEEVLVIEGTLTNETKAHVVKISYTYPLTTNQAKVVDDAIVYIEDNDGNRTTLEGAGNGEYKTQGNFQGLQGASYKLVVQMSDNRRYESSYEPMTISPPVDSIYSRFASLSFSDQANNDNGVQFFLDTHDDTEAARFFRYEFEETWQVKSPYGSRWYADTSSYFEVSEEGELEKHIDTFLVSRDVPLGTCYAYDQSNAVNIGTSANNAVNRLTEHPITFVSQSSQKLRTRYSILVRQYAISEDAFTYYRKLKENNESSGSLFDRQTGTVVGNIKNVNDPGEAVLGFFEVSGYTERREFFNSRDFEDPFRPARYPYECLYDQAIALQTDSAARFVFGQLYERYQVYVINSQGGPPELDTALIFEHTCTSCHFFADSTKPPYWYD